MECSCGNLSKKLLIRCGESSALYDILRRPESHGRECRGGLKDDILHERGASVSNGLSEFPQAALTASFMISKSAPSNGGVVRLPFVAPGYLHPTVECRVRA